MQSCTVCVARGIKEPEEGTYDIGNRRIVCGEVFLVERPVVLCRKCLREHNGAPHARQPSLTSERSGHHTQEVIPFFAQPVPE